MTTAERREVHRDSLALHYNTDVTLSDIRARSRIHKARADTRTWRPPCWSLSLSLSRAALTAAFGQRRPRSAAAAKYARTCQTESLSYQGGLRRYTIRTYIPTIATTFTPLVSTVVSTASFAPSLIDGICISA